MSLDESNLKQDASKQEEINRRFNAIIRKWGNLPAHYKTVAKLLPIFIILAAIPLTVRLTQMQQNFNQYATGTNDLYVSTTGADSNSCTQAAPCKTIAHTATLAIAGTTVHVAPGIYTESTITVSQSGSVGNPITFISDSPLGAKIADTSWHAFYVTGDFITIKGFEIYMTNPGSASAIIETHGSNETITGNYLHDLDNNVGASCYGGAAIDVYENNNITVSNNKIANVGPSTSCDQMHGVYIGGSNNVVINNIVWNVSGYCYQGWPIFVNSQMMNNDGENCRSGGIIIGWDGTTLPQTNNVVVGNNIMRSITGYGIRDCCSSTAAPGTNMQYLNNNVSGASLGNYFFYQPASINLGGISVDPGFTSSVTGGGGDYHLQSISRMIDNGTSTDAPSIDYDDNTRPQGKTIDIGAYEYVSSTLSSSPTPTITPTFTPTPTLKPTFTPTPTLKPTFTPTPTPTFKPTFTPTPTPIVSGPTATPTPIPTLTPTPTPTLKQHCYKVITWKFCF